MGSRDHLTCYSSGDWKIQNDSAVVASGYLLPNNGRQRQRRRITIRSNKSRKCSVRPRKRKDCYCTNRPVPTRINFETNQNQCYHFTDNCPFPEQEDEESYMFEPIEKISLYNTTMLQKARELLDYEPSTLFLKKLKAEACKAVLRESGGTRNDSCKYTKARQAYEQYVNLRKQDDSLVQPCMCKYPNPNADSDIESKKNDANIQTLCAQVQLKSTATETNNRCCPKCCRCQKDKSTVADICGTEREPKQQEVPPKQQEDTPKQKVIPKPQVDMPKPQVDMPKPQVDMPKPQVDMPKPQVDMPKPQVDMPKQQENKPKQPPPVQKEKPKEIPKPQTAKKPKSPKPEKKIPTTTKKCDLFCPLYLSPDFRAEQRLKKQLQCEHEPSCSRNWCNHQQGSENIKDLQEFRNDCYFETHSVKGLADETPKHDCIHLMNFDEKLQPHYVNTDPFGYSRCYVCNTAMTTVQKLAAKKPVMENVETYRKSKLSSLSMTRTAPIAIEPTRIQISNKSQKIMAKLPPYCEQAGSFIKTKYQRPVPTNSFALRFQKGVYNN